LLLILSSGSVASDWVVFETQADAAREVSERSKVLLPIRLDEAVLQSPQPWAVETRENRHMADFIGWKDPEAYRASSRPPAPGTQATKKDAMKGA
jgi:hypothetical protein